MYRNRIIPCLLLQGKGLYKTTKFKDARYLGDPINTVRLFNDKEVDELVILDIEASLKDKPIQKEYLKKVVSECFMPVGYGGGISSIQDVEDLFKMGIEKVIFNTALVNDPNLVKKAVKNFGSQSIVASIDVKKNLFGNCNAFIMSGTQKVKTNLFDYIEYVQKLGVGEIVLTSIDHEGMMEGYDYNLIDSVSKVVKVPLVANGGSASLQDCVEAIKNGASAAAAASIFVYYGARKAVLVNYPTHEELMKAFEEIER